MKHPSREEWIEYLNDESPLGDRERLRAHLHECEACAGELESWRDVVRALPSWTVPAAERIIRPRFGGLPWPALLAAAAVTALALVAGVALAEVSHDLRNLRSQVAALRNDRPGTAENSKLAAEVASLRQSLAGLEQACSRSTNDIEHFLVSVGEVNRLNREAMIDLAGQEKAAREQEHAALLQLVQESEYREQSRLALLRKDLETVASMADDQLQFTRQNLIRISATSRTNHP